ncbi:MAG: hypothetical protein ABF908_03940 [Lentilactobacillus diolivorans]
MQKIHQFLTLFLLTTGLIIGIGLPNTSAQAKYTQTPTSLRGYWQRPAKGDARSVLIIKKYKFEGGLLNKEYFQINTNDDWQIRGDKYLKGTKTPQLYVNKKNRNGYYKLGKVNTKTRWYLKKVKHNGKVALKSYVPNALGPAEGKVFYYYKFKGTGDFK